MNENGFIIGSATWPEDLQLGIPPKDLKYLIDIDREAVFNGMRDFFREMPNVEVLEKEEELQERLGSSSGMLIPGTRIFIGIEASLQDWAKRMIKIVALYGIVGIMNPSSAIAGLSIDLVIAILEKLHKLDLIDTDIIITILESRKSKNRHYPDSSDIASALKCEEVKTEIRLSSLKDRGIIQRREGGWDVIF